MSDRLLPDDWQRGPRYGGAYTFARVPASRDLTKADVVIVGVPMDMAVLYRPGARFGPRAIRDASGQLRPHHWDADKLEPPFDTLRIIDYGDLEVFPGYIEQTMEQLTAEFTQIAESGVFPLVLGGDHASSLPVLRGLAASHGKMSLVHFDAHPDFWPRPEGRPYHHGTPFRIATAEGLIDPATSLQVGIRGSLSANLIDEARAAGFHLLTATEFAEQGVEATLADIRRIAKPPIYVSIDVDSVDPAFAPGTGTPEVAGLTSREIVALVRGLPAADVVGLDVVEVAPAYDNAEITALLAANLVLEFLLVRAASGNSR
ncbi:MAG TPA: agmatinase [Dehalococcoidia bacterium]|nr:agmatinase [Dehalococcoidia bacterium]